MTTKKISFLRLFNLYNFKLGTKINLMVIGVIVLTLVVGVAIGMHLFRKYLEQVNYDRLESLAELKKAELEKQYHNFYKELPLSLTSDQISSIEALQSAFGSYESDNPVLFSDEAFQSDTMLLSQYYKDEIIDKIKWKTPQFSEVFPKNKRQLLLQYFYTANKDYSTENKEQLLFAEDNSGYSSIHKVFHSQMRGIARKYNLKNIYLIDKSTGDIFYNLNKNIAFADNLFNGQFKQSELALIFQKTLVLGPNKAIINDFTFFLPEYNKPVQFFAFPVYNGTKMIAVFIAELSPDFYENILYGNQLTKDKKVISINLIGKDNLIRTNDINQLINPVKFFKEADSKGRRKIGFKQISLIESSSMVLGYNKEIDLPSGIDIKTKGYLNNDVYLCSIPLELEGLDWTIVTSIGSSEAYSFIKKWSILLLTALLLVIIISLVVTNLIKKSIISRMKGVSNSMTRLVNGEDTENIETPWKDEIGETIDVFNKLKARFVNTSQFLTYLSTGNYNNAEFIAASEKDGLAISLNTLKEQLKTNKTESEIREKEDMIRNWTNEGIAKFNDLLRQSNNNINNLAYLIIENLIYYLDANQGGVFLVERESEDTKIKLIASFAYDKRKYTTKTIEIGEGLLGNCYLERKPIYLKDIPEEYIEITSGLGKASPRTLYIAPMILDNEVLGFLEIASFKEFEDYQIDFINKLTENIAATFSTVKLNTRTAELLEESKRRANEIAQQEEEMRQNLEEMRLHRRNFRDYGNRMNKKRRNFRVKFISLLTFFNRW